MTIPLCSGRMALSACERTRLVPLLRRQFRALTGLKNYSRKSMTGTLAYNLPPVRTIINDPIGVVTEQ